MPTAAHLLRLAQEAAPADASTPTDTELLRRYTSERDEEAFAELVRRNGPLVLRACRHILGETGADDAFQAVFLLLVRSARRLSRPGSLAGWLHAAAVRIANNARRGEGRRRKREAARPAATATPDDLTWREVREVLDAEIAELPELYRLPVVLCYLQELTHEEAARRAGCSVGALRGRLERGKERLRKKLVRYGLPLATPALVVGSPPPVSAALLARTIEVVRSASTNAVPPALNGLLSSTGRLRSTLLLMPIAAVVAAIGVVLAAGGPSADPPKADPPRPASPLVAAADPQRLVDALGDPLPPGAIARLGTARFQHGYNLSRVVVSADGKLVASGTRWGSYKLWEGTTGRPVPLWEGLTKFAPGKPAVRFDLTSAEGQLVAVLWDVGGSRVLDSVTGELIRKLPGFGPLSVPELAPDGKTLVAIWREFVDEKPLSTIRIWNAGSEKWTVLGESPGEPAIRAFQFSNSSKRVAYYATNGAVTVWDVMTARPLLKLPETTQRVVDALAFFSPDGKLLAKEDLAMSKIRVWNVDTGKELPELPDQPVKLGHGAAFSPDGKVFAAVVHPITIRLWDVVARKKLRDIQGHDFQVKQLAFTNDGKRLYAADGNGLSVWDPTTGTPLDDWGQHRYTIWTAAWSPDGKRIASGASYTDKIGRVWDPSTGKKVFDLVGHKFGIQRVAYSPDGSLLATGSQDGTTKLWDPTSGKELYSFEAKDGIVYAFTPDGRFLVTGGPKALHVWDVARRTWARIIPHNGDLPLQIAFFPGSQRALVQDRGIGSRVIDFATGREERMIPEVKKWSLALAISPDGRYVAHADETGAILLADAMTGHEVQVLTRAVLKKTDFQEVMGLAFSPDGRTIAAAHRLGDRRLPDEVRVYEVATGSERFRFAGHVSEALGVRFSPDGSRLCSFGADKTLIVWDVTGGRLASAPPPKDLDAAWTALTSPDAAKAFAAIRYMADKPTAIRLLAERVKPITAADRKTVAALIEKLGSPEFRERESASKELTKLAPAALDQLREANRKTTSQEVRTRLSAILAGTRGTFLTGEQLRSARAVEVLELTATADARELLIRLAQGAAEAGLTQEAKRALERLRR